MSGAPKDNLEVLRLAVVRYFRHVAAAREETVS